MTVTSPRFSPPFRPLPRRVADGSRHWFSGARDENSWRALSIFPILACLVFGAGCGARPVATGPATDGGTGGSTGTGGAGTGGTGGGNGNTAGTGGSVSNDGGLNCANVGCAPPPLCSVGCQQGCGCCPCTSGERNGNLVCTGGCYAPVPTDASVDQSGDATTDGAVRDATPDAAVCDSIMTDYATALGAAQQCTVGAANQCALQVRAGFFCNCTTFANSGADTLAAIVANFQASGCLARCTGTCVQVQALSCLADATSTTGGRCKLPGVLALLAANNGGTFTVSVGEEVDITLESIAPGSYSTNVMLSSDLATVLEIAIPAGPPNPDGATHLYRLRALAAGVVQIQIPFEPAASGTPGPTYAVTIAVR